MAIEEIIPGVHHWTQHHPRIRVRVHSHYVAGSGTVIDPLVPDEGIEWFDDGGIERVVLSNRHHLRHAERFAERYGVPVLCHVEGLHEFAGGPDVQGYAPGDRPAPDVVALEMDAICPDDTALAIDAGGGALLFADAIINYGEVGFVRDELIGDDPEGVKRRVRERAAALCGEREFEHLLFAHGDPVIGGGREALQRFAAG
jgi:hypothetical protein